MVLVTLLAGWLAQAAPAAAPKDVLHTNSDPEFSVRLPAGYARAATGKDTVATFVRSKGREEWERIYVDLVVLTFELDPKAARSVGEIVRQLPMGDVRETRPIKLTWENLDLDGIECRFARDGVDMSGRCVWVPTSPRSVAICVSGPSTLAKELSPELLALLSSFKGRTQWLTEGEASSLRFWRAPAYAVPVLSGLFLLAWAAFFRAHSLRLHYLRVAWHAVIPLLTVVAYYLLQHSAPAREKLGIATPHYLWMLVIAPLAIFHIVMIAHRVRMAVELGD